MNPAIRPAPSPSLEQLVRRLAARLKSAGLSTPRLEAEILASHRLGWSRARLLSRGPEPAPEDVVGELEALAERRAAGEPLQYVTGVAEFRSLEFQVDPRVLIPRPETELVVEECLRCAPRPAPRILDIGTGSGCIAIALAAEIPAARITGVDRSVGALAVARENARRLLPGTVLSWIQGDLLEPLCPSEPADVIVSNPPYVAAGEMDALEVQVRDHEPRPALVAGDTGLEVLERLVRRAGEHLVPGGFLVLEIGAGQWPALRERIRATAGWAPPAVRNDFQQIPRVVTARREGGSQP